MLTPRQTEVLMALSFGLTHAEIAKELGISYWTAKEHSQDIRERLGVKNNGQAIAYGFRHGILSTYHDV